MDQLRRNDASSNDSVWIPLLSVLIFYLFVFLLGLSILVVVWTPTVSSAPAPFPRSQRKPQLTRDDLIDSWEMKWAGHAWNVELGRDGSYRCQNTNLLFVGSCGLDGFGRFWITESSNPSDPNSWRSYSVSVCPRSLCGKIEHGSPGTEFSLKRR